MKRLRQGCWLQLAFALWALGAIGIFYVHVTRPLPLVPRVTIRPDYSPTKVLFSPDSKRLVTLPDQNVVSRIDIWDAGTGTHRFSLCKGENVIPTVELSPDGRLLWSLMLLVCWGLTPRCVQTLEILRQHPRQKSAPCG